MAADGRPTNVNVDTDPTARDEALARRLQDEERAAARFAWRQPPHGPEAEPFIDGRQVRPPARRTAPSTPAADPPCVERVARQPRAGAERDAPGRGRGARGDARVNVANDLARQSHNLRLQVIISTVFNVPQVVAAVLALVVSVDAVCDKPLRTWVAVAAIQRIINTAIGWILYREGTIYPAYMSRNGRIAHCMKYPVDTSTLVWSVFGNVWVLSSTSCHETNPALYFTTVVMVGMQYLYLFLPCIVLVILLPFACCCLPCLIRVFAAVRDPQHGKGAAADAVKKLPCEKFRAGMFAEEDGSAPSCPICVCEFEEGEEVRTLPCDGHHNFHKRCIDEWLVINATCPNCRAQVLPSVGGRATGGQRRPGEAGRGDADAGAAAGGAGESAAGAAAPAGGDDRDETLRVSSGPMTVVVRVAQTSTEEHAGGAAGEGAHEADGDGARGDGASTSGPSASPSAVVPMGDSSSGAQGASPV